LKTNLTPTEDHQIKLSIEMEDEAFQIVKKRAARKIAKQIKIPGFRPGKAPYNIIKKNVGEAVIREEAIELFLEEAYSGIIDESDLDPYGPGKLDNISSSDPPSVDILIPLAPVVELGKHRDLRLPYEEIAISEEDVSEVIDNILDQHAVIEPVDRPAAEGDMVYVLISGERRDSIPDEETELIEERRLPVVIESEDIDSTDEWPFPGFSQELIGLTSGSEISFDHSYPEDSEIEDFRGHEINFLVRVEEIKGRSVPDLDDDFAKSLGDYDDLDALQSKVKDELVDVRTQEKNAEYEEQILDEIIALSKIKFPPQMLEDRIDQYIDDLKLRLQRQGLDFETYLKSVEKDEETIREEVRETQEERLRKSLVLMEISRVEEISVSDEDVDNRALQTFNEITRSLTEEDAKKLIDSGVIDSLKSQIVGEELTVRTLERLRTIAKGEMVEEIVIQEESIEKSNDIEIESAKTEGDSADNLVDLKEVSDMDENAPESPDSGDEKTT
jgi:trigger factor